MSGMSPFWYGFLHPFGDGKGLGPPWRRKPDVALSHFARPGAMRGILSIRGMSLHDDEDIPGVWIADGKGSAIFHADDGREMQYTNPLLVEDDLS